MPVSTGREIFAIPGHPKDPRATGTSKLIKEGAHLTETPDDIFDARPVVAVHADQVQEEIAYDVSLSDDISKACQKIKSLLSHTPVSLESLRKTLDTSPRLLQAALIELEIAGLISWMRRGILLTNEPPFEKGLYFFSKKQV